MAQRVPCSQCHFTRINTSQAWLNLRLFPLLLLTERAGVALEEELPGSPAVEPVGAVEIPRVQRAPTHPRAKVHPPTFIFPISLLVPTHLRGKVHTHTTSSLLKSSFPSACYTHSLPPLSLLPQVEQQLPLRNGVPEDLARPSPGRASALLHLRVRVGGGGAPALHAHRRVHPPLRQARRPQPPLVRPSHTSQSMLSLHSYHHSLTFTIQSGFDRLPL